VILFAWDYSPAPATPASCLASDLSSQDLSSVFFVLIFWYTGTHSDHAESLGLDDAADTFNLMAEISRAKMWRSRGAMGAR
jgi:hypothetical protein